MIHTDNSAADSLEELLNLWMLSGKISELDYIESTRLLQSALNEESLLAIREWHNG